MPRVFPVKADFSKGVFSDLLDERIDEPIYKSGARTLENVFAIPTGGACMRGGTVRVAPTKYDFYNVNLETFAFSDEPSQSYTLEFGDKYLRILHNHAPIKDVYYDDPTKTVYFVGSGVNDCIFSGSYTGSQQVHYKIVIEGHTLAGKDIVGIYANDILQFEQELNSDGYYYIDLDNGLFATFTTTSNHNETDSWNCEVGLPLQLSSPFDVDEVDDIRLEQKEDVIFIFSENHIPHKLSRFSHENWSLEAVDWPGAPWLIESTLKYKFYSIRPVYDQIGNPDTTSEMDQYFNSAYGAVLIDEGTYSDKTISWDSGYEYYPTNEKYTQSLAEQWPSMEFFSWEAKGDFVVETEGTYTFAINADSAGDIVIDGEVICKRYGDVGALNPSASNFQTSLASYSGTKYLTAGSHKIKVRLYVKDSISLIGAYWKKPGDSTYTLIPPKHFTKEPSKYGVTNSTFRYFAIDDAVYTALPPTSYSEMNALFTEQDGITLTKTGKYSDRVSFHSNANYLGSPFYADSPSDYMKDKSVFAWELSGWITIEESADYFFAIDSNDAADFIIYQNDSDPILRVEWYGLHTCYNDSGLRVFNDAGFEAHNSGNRYLPAGVYSYKFRLYSQSQGFGAALAWKKPGDESYEIIPHTVLTPSNGLFPAVGKFHQSRLWIAGSLNEPRYLYGSKSLFSREESFVQGPEADDSIRLEVDSASVDRILWMESKDKALIIGTRSKEYSLSSQNGVITPDDNQIIPTTSIGSSFIKPLLVEDSLIFVDKSGTGIREYAYELSADNSVGVNIALLNQEMFSGGIKKMVYQSGNLAAQAFTFNDDLKEMVPPRNLNIVWVLGFDGKLKSLVREKNEKVWAWSSHTLGGEDVYVHSMTVLPGETGDEIQFVVSRWKSGVTGDETERQIEYISPNVAMDNATITTSNMVDDITSITATVPANNTCKAIGINFTDSGDYEFTPILNAEDSETLTVDVSGDVDVSNTPANVAVICGYPFDVVVETLPFERMISADDSTLNFQKRWVDVNVSCVSTSYIRVSRSNSESAESVSSPTLLTGTYNFKLLGWDSKQALRITQTHSVPFLIRNISGKMQVNFT